MRKFASAKSLKTKPVTQPPKPLAKKVAPAVRRLPGRAKGAVGAGPPRKQLARAAFDEVVVLIGTSRHEAGWAVNVQLIARYWKIGAVISTRIERDSWGKGTVAELAAHLTGTQVGTCSFSPQNLWRMRRFFETDRKTANLSTALRKVQPKAALPSKAPLQCKLNELYAQLAQEA